MNADINAAVEFLELFSPNGPWVLTAIAVDRKGITTETHTDRRSVAAWVTRHSAAGENIYFAVNPVRHALQNKAGREDINALAWLHVDIDPRVGEDLTSERVRILALLQAPTGEIPPPTIIVDSGGGYQGFWRLSDPLPLDGSIEAADAAARFNQQIELTLGADSCHNIDRIMRLPGTINQPDAKKKAKGRVAALASLIVNTGVAYPLSGFTAARPVQTAGASAGFTETVQISGNVARLGSVDELPDKVPDSIKVLIVQGHDPDDPGKYASRSEALFAACCALVRGGLSDDEIFAVVTDPDFRISASVLDKGSSAPKYAARQIARAREEAVDPVLREFNERHAVVANIGSKCRVVEELIDPVMGRSRLTLQSFEDFRNRYMHRRIQTGMNAQGAPTFTSAGKWWLEHTGRRQYGTVVFSPEHDVAGAYNLWRGFSCDARPGGDCSMYLDHIHTTLASGNKEHSDYIIGWLANAVQHPARPAGTSIVLRGRQGTGKGVFASIFGSLWGRHYMHVSDPRHLVGNFNSHLQDCVVLFGDESFFAGDKKHESVLKMLITESMFTVERKGFDAEATPNFLHVILASNSQWVVPADADERRFCVFDVDAARMQDADHFAKMIADMNNGGREALLHYLLHYDLTDFNPRAIPQTAALADQKMMSMAPEREWWLAKLLDGQLVRNAARWSGAARRSSMHEDYLMYVQRIGLQRRMNSVHFGRFITSVCPGDWPHGQQKSVEETIINERGEPITVKGRAYFYEFPSLTELREHFDKLFGGPFDWPAVETEQLAEGVL